METKTKRRSFDEAFQREAVALLLKGVKPIKLLAATGTAPARMTPAREKVLAAAAEGPLPGPELAAKAGVGAGVVKGLIDEGCLEVQLHTPETVFPEPDTARPGPTLNASQKVTASHTIKTG